MQTFKDKDGKDWIIDLNLSHIKLMEAHDYSEISRYNKIKFLPPQEDLFTEVITNPAVCFTMVWCCCQKQATEVGIETELQFAERFNGETIQNSRIAMYEELPPFFPEQQTTLEALISRYGKIQKMADTGMRKILDEKLGDKELEDLMEEGLQNVANNLDLELTKTRINLKTKEEETKILNGE